MKYSKTLIKDYGTDMSKMPKDKMKSQYFAYRMFREAKNGGVSKDGLVKGLTVALEKKIDQASKELFDHIKTFT